MNSANLMVPDEVKKLAGNFRVLSVVEYPGYYITENGVVISCHSMAHKIDYSKSHIMKPMKSASKYKSIDVAVGSGKRKVVYVHIMVANAFLESKPFESAEVRHWDDNPENNHISNLLWGTRLENVQDSKRNGHIPLGENRSGSVLTSEQVIEIRSLCKSGIGQREIANRFNISQQTVSGINTRKIWSHLGESEDVSNE